jgi:hypothetical protein
VVLSTDPLAVEIGALDLIQVHEVWVGGVRQV